jgi:SAM-dependent methyltransferase
MTILDFASGYGRVARHMKNVVPNGKMVAIDLEETAMYFNTAHLGLQAAVFDPDPARVSPFFEFDVVMALSFLSTQPRPHTGMWLEALAGFTKPAGIVLLTMPGTQAPYGTMRELERIRPLDLVLYRAGATRGQDDLYVLRKAA